MCSGPESVGVPRPAVERTVLVPSVHTADPSARVLNDSLYVIASHDIATSACEDDDGSHFDMRSYRLLRFNEEMTHVVDCGDVLPLGSVPWAGRQLWAPDIVCGRGGKFFLYFPARDKGDGHFRIGVAVADTPEGPYTAEPKPIPGSYSIDPAVLQTADGSAYLYFGGLMGGELQHYPKANGRFRKRCNVPSRGAAMRPRCGKLAPDMKSFDKAGVFEMQIVDAEGKEIGADDTERVFFEGPFVYERKGMYYFLYSTGWSHLIQYATSASPVGPWLWRGRVLSAPQGWTSQVSVASFRGRDWLFYHTAKRSGKNQYVARRLCS